MDMMSLRFLCQAGLKHVRHCQFAEKYACDYKKARLKHWRASKVAVWRHLHSQSGIKFTKESYK